jgi:hypothetical protein
MDEGESVCAGKEGRMGEEGGRERRDSGRGEGVRGSKKAAVGEERHRGESGESGRRRGCEGMSLWERLQTASIRKCNLASAILRMSAVDG